MPPIILLKGGRLLDPSQHLDAKGDLLLVDGKIARAGGTIDGGEDAQVIDCADAIVSPGSRR